MNKYAILVDSTSNIPNGTVINGIKVYNIPLYIYVNDEEYKENETITIEDISKAIEKVSEFRSSQPSTLDFLSFYEKMAEDDVTHCIAIHFSSGISGTFQNSVLSSTMQDKGIETLVFDSLAGSYIVERMVKDVTNMISQNENESWDFIKKEAVSILEEIRDDNKLYVIPSSLKQLVKSGRANTAQLVATTVLNIKIILHFDKEGKLQIKEKVRSDKKLKQFIENLIEDAIQLNRSEFAILYSDNKEEMSSLMEEFKIKYPSINFVLKQMIPIVAIHTGNGTLAVTY